MSEINISETIRFARAVLNAAPGDIVNLAYNFNYLKTTKYKRQKDFSDSRIIYTVPGQARTIKLKEQLPKPKFGIYPKHNSEESYELLPSLDISIYSDLFDIESLIANGFEKRNVTLTKKKIAKLHLQFSHLSIFSFQEMLCLNQEDDKRDFEVWLKHNGNELLVAYINPRYSFVQFLQSIRKNFYDEIVDVKHVVCEMGRALVINQSCMDSQNRIRNIAHVGITGSAENAFRNSLERFDNGSIVWTTTDYKNDEIQIGAACLRQNGEVIFVENSNLRLATFSARNLGAEGVDPETLSWTGSFDESACVAEEFDKYIMRTEYKNQVKDKVYQIIDGACLPGLEPIFDVHY